MQPAFQNFRALNLILVVCLVGAPTWGEETIQIGVSDLMKLADHGVVSSRVEAERIWDALRASQRRRADSGAQGTENQNLADLSDVAGAVRDLQRLLSFTNLLYCIAATLLTAVFTFLLYTFREEHVVQAITSFGYAAIFVYWGLQLLNIGVVSNSASEGSSGSQLIGGVLLMVPNIAALAFGAAAVEVLTGRRWSQLFEEWSSMHILMMIDNRFCLSCTILASSVMACSSTLYAVSAFPLLLVPFLGSLYTVSIFIGLFVAKQLTFVVWVSMLHSLVLWCLAHSGIFGADISLGLMISACNSGFWSFPYMLIAFPMGLASDSAVQQRLNQTGASDIGAWIQSELWDKPTFVISLVVYAAGNIAVLYYGLRIKSWVPLPYALIGVVVTMLLSNHAPPRTRMVWRLLYNFPMALFLFAASSAYGRITDTLWLGILAWLGHPRHFLIIAIFFVRGATLICAMWSLWYGLSRLFPYRILQDLREKVQMLESEDKRLAKVREALEKKQGAPERKQSTGLFARFRLSKPPQPPPKEEQEESLRAELNTLEKSQETRSRQLITVRSKITSYEASGLLVVGCIPMCWVGYSILAAVCDAPEPFSMLAFVLDVNCLIYLSRGFGGLILSAIAYQEVPHSRFAEWRADVPLKICLPMLAFFGVRVIALAEGSFLRNIAGIMLLGACFAGVLRTCGTSTGTLLASPLSIGIMAYGLLFDLKLLIIIGVISLYCLGVNLLCNAMGNNTVSIVCAITALALGTMHLGISYEAYFLALQKVAGPGMLFGETWHALVASASIEKRLSLALIHEIELVFKL